MNNARLIFYPPSLAKYTCTYLRSTLLLYSQPLASEDVFYSELSFQFPDRAWRHAQIFWAGLMIHYVDCSSSSFKHMFSYKKKKIDDIVWKTKYKIWKWLNRLYSMKLKKRYPDANITYYIYICLTSCGKGHRSRCLIVCSHASKQNLIISN